MILSLRSEACLRKRKHGTRFVARWRLSGGTPALGGAGCATHTKAALTEEEIRQKTLAYKPERPDVLLVSGERVTFDDVLSLSPEADAAPPTLKDKLIEMARQMPLESFMKEAAARHSPEAQQQHRQYRALQAGQEGTRRQDR